MFSRLREDIRTVFACDPAARTWWEVLTCYPGLHAVWRHRIAHALWNAGLKWCARLLSHFNRFMTGIEIHPGAKLGRRCFIDHGMGIVIGETAEVGDDVLLYQGVTLGGSGKEKNKRHPTLGNGVLVGAGAKILGSFRVGDNARIAANAVVLQEIPDNATAVGIPATVVRVAGKRVEELDHTGIPNPVAQELRRLRERVSLLEKNCPRNTNVQAEEADL